MRILPDRMDALLKLPIPERVGLGRLNEEVRDACSRD
jgi:hypothetical protein